MIVPAIVDERSIERFRREHLAPEALLRLVDEHFHVLVRVAVGVGKSHAVDELLEHPGLFSRFDYVVYAAPTWQILRERRIVGGAAAPVPWLLLEPRPRSRCGSLDADWLDLERRSCTAYAKATLCRECPQREGHSPCTWPEQFGRVKAVRMLFLPEQQLYLNRTLVPMLRVLASAERVLIVLDEARLLDANFEVAIADRDLELFAKVLSSLPSTPVYETWKEGIAKLLAHDDLQAEVDFPPWLLRDVLTIQQVGIQTFGSEFKNVAYDLGLLATSRPTERWREGDKICFIGRPLLRCQALVLSANMTGEYAGDRLGGGHLASPFELVVFAHTGTRIVNLRSRIGADRYFHRNSRQILDTVAVLIARNVQRGVSTMLVSRKKSKQSSAKYLTERLARWGVAVRFVDEGYDTLPAKPHPDVVPIIHYGILGVNDFCDYQACYCINSYYISPHQLSRAVQEASPRAGRVSLGIDSRPDHVRRAKVLEGADPAGVLAHTANIYLAKLELDPVVQAAGRVRFATKPREVVFFQMADLAPLVGPHEVVTSLQGLREELGVRSAGEVDQLLEAAQLRDGIRAGQTAAQAAAKAGISRRTLYRRLALTGSARNPSKIFQRESGTPDSLGDSA